MSSLPSAHGQWICPSLDSPPNTWICYRTSFDLASVPGCAVLKIAVDSKYWLWVNGRSVVFEGGLKRGPAPSATYVDEVDIHDYLSTGPTTIAVLVWFFGKDGFSHQNSGRPGLWIESMDLPCVTDASWKCLVHPAYGNTGEPRPNWRFSESNVRFDAALDIPGWTQPAFDDSSWSGAVEAGTPPCAPWGPLVKRPIPQWMNSGLCDYVNASDFPRISSGGFIVARLPYNAQVTPCLKVHAPHAGLRIYIRTDTYNAGGTENVRAEYLTREGEQEFECLGWMSGHEVLYEIPFGIRILSLKYRETGYDAEFAGSFTCSDPDLNTLWTKSARTVYVCMRDTYMDCPDRERAQWMADGALEIGVAAYAFGPSASALSHKAYSELVNWRKSDGVLFNPIPAGNWTQELPVQVMNSIGWYGIWQYYMLSGDRDILVKTYPFVRDYILGQYGLDDDGLVAHRAGDWDFQDWGEGADVRLIDNGWYYLCLRGLLSMAHELGMSGDLPGISSRMASMAANFDQVLWKGTHYTSGELIDDRGNALAVLTGLVPAAHFPAIRELLLTVKQASPHMEKFVLEALYVMGYPDDALNRMKQRYADMIASPLTTLPELFGGGTVNHGWSAGPLMLLGQFAAGIAPDSPGFGTYHVLPAMGRLTAITTTVPTPHGRIEVSLRDEGATFIARLVSPEGTTAIVGIPQASEHSFTRISVNGVWVWEDGVVRTSIAGVKFLVGDSRFVRFAVRPGDWLFAAGK